MISNGKYIKKSWDGSPDKLDQGFNDIGEYHGWGGQDRQYLILNQEVKISLITICPLIMF